MSLKLILNDIAARFVQSESTTKNYALWSDDLTNAAWTKIDCAAEKITEARPNNVSGTVCKLTETSGTSIIPTAQQLNRKSLVAGEWITLSACCKLMGASRYLRVDFTPGTEFGWAYAYFDLLTGSVVTKSSTVIARAFLVNGWVLIAASCKCITACTAGVSFKLSQPSNYFFTYAGDGASGIKICAVQIEPGSVVTSPIPTSGSTVAGTGWTLPAENLVKVGRSRVARTATALGSVVLGSAAEVATVSGVVLHGHTLSTTGWWTVELFSGANQTGELLYSGEKFHESSSADALTLAHSAHWLAPVSARSMRITVNDPFGSGTYVQAMYLVMGNVVEPQSGFELNGGVSWCDDSTQRRSLSGSLRTSTKPKYRRASITCSLITELERARIASDLAVAGMTKRVAVSLFAGEGGAREGDHAFVGKITSMPSETIVAYGEYAMQMNIDEV